MVLRWSTVATGRIGSKPIAYGDHVFFAAHDGYVYKINPVNGEIAWRVLVAPNYQQMVAFGQLESVWPCFGVLEHEGVLYATAGRSSTLDQGIHAAAINPENGNIKWRSHECREHGI